MKAKKFIMMLMLSAAIVLSGCETSTEVSPAGDEDSTMTDEKAAEDLASLSPEAQDGDEGDGKEAMTDDASKTPNEDVAESSDTAEGSDVAEAIIEAPDASEVESTAIYSLQTVYFEFDKANIGDDFKATLARNYEWIKQNPTVKVQLEGHADERGTNEYNLALGERRANAVLKYLMSLGANSEQFSTISFGEERPENGGHNDEAWSKNRRVEFTRL